jgi:hypothetical protein
MEMKIVRNRGSWYGKINGKDQELPIGHSTCVDWANKRYVDRGCREPKGTPVDPKWLRWIDAVRTAGCMIIQETKVGPDKGADGYPMNHCVGYIGAFFVDNVQLDENRVFSCDIVRRRTV